MLLENKMQNMYAYPKSLCVTEEEKSLASQVKPRCGKHENQREANIMCCVDLDFALPPQLIVSADKVKTLA